MQHLYKKSIIYLGTIVCSTCLLIGCTNQQPVTDSSIEQTSSVSSETTSSVSPNEQIHGEMVAYKEAKELLKEEVYPVTLSYIFQEPHSDNYGYQVQEQPGYEEVKELLEVYFGVFLKQQYWANYDFVDDEVLDRWETMHQFVVDEQEFLNQQGIVQEESIELFYVSYNDEENYYLDLSYQMQVHHLHLKKENLQWNVVAHCMSKDSSGYYSEEDAEMGSAMQQEALQKSREKNPLTESQIQECIDCAINEGFEHRMTEEKLELWKPEMEGIYDEEWCDRLLRLCMAQYNINLNQPACIVWLQPKEGYDASLEDLKQKAFGDADGSYRIVYFVPEEGWKNKELVFTNFPEYTIKDQVEWKIDGVDIYSEWWSLSE